MLIPITHTLVPLQPRRKAASCANNSPKPSISPFTKGKKRLIAAPRSRLHIVGGEYSIKGGDCSEDGGGEGERWGEEE